MEFAGSFEKREGFGEGMTRGLWRLGRGEWNIYGFVGGESGFRLRALDRKRKNIMEARAGARNDVGRRREEACSSE